MEKRIGRTIQFIKKSQSLKAFRTNSSGLIGLFLVCFILACAVIAPFIPSNIYEVRGEESFLPPSSKHPFGTDSYGRDIFGRTLYGARISLQIGILSVAIALCIGVPLGLISGYFGKWIDIITMRCMDAIFSFPTIVLALAIMAMVGSKLINLIVVLGVVYSPVYARLARASSLATRESAYVLSAKAIGCSNKYILIHYILPSCLLPVLVQTTITIAGAILAEAGLSFLGLGIPPPTPSWGTMLRESRGYMEIAPWTCIFPGLAIMIAILGFNFFGDGLRDSIDPRLKTIRR